MFLYRYNFTGNLETKLN